MARNSSNKISSIFVCQQCGYQSPSFLGRCPNCGEWNTMVEEIKNSKAERGTVKIGKVVEPKRLADIKDAQIKRVSTGISELDMVLGGGLVPGMAVLLAGEPGIGKSTLLLQIAERIYWQWRDKQLPPAASGSTKEANSSPFLVLYVAGEESAGQIKIRAQRLGIGGEGLVILEMTDVDDIVGFLDKEKNLGLIIVDSVQTLTTADLGGTAGSVGQVRECAARLISACKARDISLFLVGHVTKEGVVAGPKVLEHAVDTILNLEGEKFTRLRLLRVAKNRFGPTDEVGVLEMKDNGLVPADLSALAAAEHGVLPGSCLTVTMEGTRPMLAEIQALVTTTFLPNPRRVASGIDHNRLLTIIAILQKKLNLPLYKEDIYVSVAGGLKIADPGVDLAVALAILSSYRNKPLPPRSVAIGELDLLGNVRRVGSQEKRLREAKKLGFSKIIDSLNWQEK